MIKRVNPFIVLGVLFFILLLLVFGVFKRENSVEYERTNLAGYEAYAKNLQNLKTSWDQKKASSRISAITSSLKLKTPPNIQKTGNKIVVQIKNIDKTHSDKVIKDLLNQPFAIKHLSMKRVSDKELEILFEVVL